MKTNKKQAGLIAGLICVLLLILLLLTMCNGGGNSSDQNKPTESSVVVETTGETQSPEETTEAVEETTEATEETTEATEATEETTSSSTGSGSSKPGGSTGYVPDSGTTGGNTSTDNSDSEDTVTETTPAAGSEGSPYLEFVTDYPDAVTTVVLPASGTIYYNLNITDETLTDYGESLLTIEDADAYVIYNGKTYKAADGVVSVPIAAPRSADTPVSIQLGSSKARAVLLNFNAPLGTKENPVAVTADAQGLIAISASLTAGDADGCYYQFAAAEDGILELRIDSASSGANCDLIVVVGDKTVKLSESREGKISLELRKDETVSIQVMTVDSTHPASVVSISGTIAYAQIGSAQRPETVTDTEGEITISTKLEADDADGYHYQYTATDDSTLTLKADNIAEAVAWDIVVTVGDATKKLSECEADAATGEKLLSVDLEKGETAVIQMIAIPDDEGKYPETEVALTGSVSYALGTKNNPMPIYSIPFMTEVIEPEDAMYYSVYGAGGLTLSIADEDAYMILGEVQHNAGDTGIVSVEIAAGDPRSPVIICVGNGGDTAEAYAIAVTYPVGSMSNPAELQTGENGAEVAALAEGYFFIWTAEAEGLLTISMDTASTTNWFYTIQNTTAGLYGDNHTSADDTIVSSETIGVLKGDVIQVVVNTADSSAGTIVLNAAFSDKQASAVSDTLLTVGENTLKPVSTAVATIYRFTPEEAGTYLLEASEGTLSCWTADGDAYTKVTADETDSLLVTFEEETLLIGVSGCRSCTVTITKAVVYEGDEDDQPKADVLTLDGTETFENVDLSRKYTLYQDENGFYYLEEGGPMVLLDFTNSTYENLAKLVEASGLYYNAADQDGKVTREIYDALVLRYLDCAVEVEISGATGEAEAVVRTLYPLTDDLVYILKNVGAEMGWFDSTSSGYQFADDDEMEAESVWMFLCCYETPAQPATLELGDADYPSQTPSAGTEETKASSAKEPEAPVQTESADTESPGTPEAETQEPVDNGSTAADSDTDDASGSEETGSEKTDSQKAEGSEGAGSADTGSQGTESADTDTGET